MVNLSELNIFKNKTVFITGDTGFKGSWLAIWLLHLGAKVIGFSFESSNENNNYSICSLNNKYETIIDDIRNYDQLERAVKKYKPEFIFHLAAQSLVIDSYTNPIETFSTNIIGTANVLDVSRKSESVKVVINVTSDKCYENREIIYPYREIDPLGGKDPYSASKACAEIINNSYLNSFFNKNSNTKLSSVRSGNIFGGGDWSENRIVPDFFRSILISKPLLIRNPNSVRPWQYVLEPLYGYLLLASKLYSLGDNFSGSWNFGPDRTNLVSVKDLIESLIKISSKGSYEIVSNIDLPKEAGLLTLDITKAVNLLSWSPKLNLEKSLELTVEEYNIDKTNYQYNLEQRINHINYYMSI